MKSLPLKELLKLKSISTPDMADRIEFFLDWIFHYKKAIHRKEQNCWMEIHKLQKRLEEKARKQNYHSSVANNIFASIAVSQNTILATYKLEDANNYLKALIEKQKCYKNSIDNLSNTWVILMKLLGRL